MRAQAPEEAVRADLYALLARLFYGGPDATVLAAIAAADRLVADGDAPLSRAWRELQAASAHADVAEVSDEFNRLYVGIGKAPISIYASYYLTENYKELTLVHLRDELERFGLARKPDAAEPEDHLAGLLDVMRHLVQRSEGGYSVQSAFFNSYLKPWSERFCAATEQSEAAVYYKILCGLLNAYFALEVEYFEWTV